MIMCDLIYVNLTIKQSLVDLISKLIPINWNRGKKIRQRIYK